MPPSQIAYINTDLDLVSEQDLTPLVVAMDARGVTALLAEWQRADDRRVLPQADGCWHLTFEHAQDFGEPAGAISALLDAIESLPGEAHDLWSRCTLREFNIGYDCGAEPWAFNNGLTDRILGRMVRVGASLRITIYPERPEPVDTPPTG